jgi:hypothetical protein
LNHLITARCGEAERNGVLIAITKTTRGTALMHPIEIKLRQVHFARHWVHGLALTVC